MAIQSNMKTLRADTFVGASQLSPEAANMPCNLGSANHAVPGPRGYLRQHGASVRDAVSEAVLDLFVIGIIVVNSARQVVRLNQCASDMLQKNTGMALRGGRLVMTAHDLNRRLAAIISTACQDSIGSEFIVAPGGPALPALDVRVTPLSVGSELATVFMSESEWSLVPAPGETQRSTSAFGLHQFRALTPGDKKFSRQVLPGRENLPLAGK